MKEEVLQRIGLTGNEAKIYLALLEFGPCLVSKIVEETRLNRTHIYDRLEKLLDKGVVNYVIKSGKKYFNAVPPDKLLWILEEEELKIKKREEELRKALPELLAMTKKPEEVSIDVYKGRDGLKSLLSDILKEKKDVYILGFTGSVAKTLRFFYPHFQKKRVKLRIKRKIIADYKMKDSSIIKQPLTETRFLPKEYQSPSGMWLYGNKIVIALAGELIMVLIRSAKITKQYKNYFDILWKIAKP